MKDKKIYNKVLGFFFKLHFSLLAVKWLWSSSRVHRFIISCFMSIKCAQAMKLWVCVLIRVSSILYMPEWLLRLWRWGGELRQSLKTSSFSFQCLPFSFSFFAVKLELFVVFHYRNSDSIWKQVKLRERLDFFFFRLITWGWKVLKMMI